MKNFETVGVVREKERVYLNKIINFFGNEKRMDFYKKTERRNQFFKSLSFLCAKKENYKSKQFCIKDKYE